MQKFSLGSTIGLIVAMGILFKVMHWAGANILLTIGFSAAIFMLLMFAKTGRLNKSTNYLFITLSIFFAGLLLTILGLTCGGIILFVGSLSLVVAFINWARKRA